MELVEPESSKSDVAPLYLLDSFKDLIAQRGYQSNDIKDRKDPMNITGMSWFLRDKADQQHKHAIALREEEKKIKKSGTYLPK